MSVQLFKFLIVMLFIGIKASIIAPLASVLSQTSEAPCEVISVDNVARLEEVIVLDTPSTTASLSWSPEGNMLAISTSEGAYLYNVSDFSLSESSVTYGVDQIQDVNFNSDGRLIASGDASIQIYEALNRNLLFQNALDDPLLDSFRSLAFHPNTPILAALTLGRELWIWDFDNDSLNIIEHKDGSGIGEKVIFRPDGSQITYAIFNTVTILDTSTLRAIKNLNFRGVAVHDIAFDPSGSVLAVVDHGGLIIFFETEAYSEIDSVRVNRSAASIAFSPDSALVAIGSADRIRLSDANNLQALSSPLKELRFRGEDTGDKVRVAFSPDGTLLALASWGDEYVRIWGICS